MRVHLDAGTCQGHSRCYSLAPEVFDVDEIGFAMLTTDDELPAEELRLQHRVLDLRRRELQVDALDTATVWCPKGHLMVAQD